MSELQTTDWDETAANNNETSPNGAPEGMAPSGVNDTIREIMAQLKRWFNRVTGLADAGTLIASGGTSTAITVTYDTAPASLYTGLEVGFKVTTTCGASPTLNVNSLGAKNIQKVQAGGYTDLEANDLLATQHAKCKYDGTLDKWVLLTLPASGNTEVATKAQQEAGTSTSAAVTPGRQHFHPSAAKSWINFANSGTPTSTLDYGISSITDTATGDMTLNFDTAFSAANYAVSGSPDGATTNAGMLNKKASSTFTTSAVAIITADDDGTLADRGYNAAQVFGDL